MPRAREFACPTTPLILFVSRRTVLPRQDTMESVLTLFDFSDRHPHTYSGIADGCENTSRDVDCAVERIEKASATGALSSVAAELENLQVSRRIDDFVKRPGNSLCFAVQNGHRRIVEHLLHYGVRVDRSAVRAAIYAKDTRSLELFLKSGWDTDMTLDPSTPSALA